MTHTPILGVCVTCDRPVRVGEPKALRQVVGWEQLSARGRSTNTVTGRTPTGKVMCHDCSAHPSIPQETLV